MPEKESLVGLLDDYQYQDVGEGTTAHQRKSELQTVRLKGKGASLAEGDGTSLRWGTTGHGTDLHRIKRRAPAQG